MTEKSIVISGVAAAGSVLAAAFTAAFVAATLVNSQSTAQGLASSEIKLGNLVTVEDWEHSGSGFAGGSCTIDGTAKYKVEGPKHLTGEVFGKVHFDHETEQAYGWMIDGKGEIEIDLYRNSDAACDVKKSSQLEVKKTKLLVLPAVVQQEGE